MDVFPLETKHLYETGDRIGRVFISPGFVSQEPSDRPAVDLVLRHCVSINRKPFKATAYSVFCDRGFSDRDFSVISFGSLTTYRKPHFHTGSRQPQPKRKWLFFDRGEFKFDGRQLIVVSYQPVT